VHQLNLPPCAICGGSSLYWVVLISATVQRNSDDSGETLHAVSFAVGGKEELAGGYTGVHRVLQKSTTTDHNAASFSTLILCFASRQSHMQSLTGDDYNIKERKQLHMKSLQALVTK
jgi:hypothetical protein